MSDSYVASGIINWYKANSRKLPWRETKDPYKIWLSEIILQQTRVNQGLPYYNNFISNYPTVEELSQASEQEVLRVWQGLGYYSRARNLHACSKIIVEKYNGVFPKTYDEILKLPGIGPYTAAAIASFAYKQVVPAIDGNVFRVLSRLYGIENDIQVSGSRKIFEEYANNLIPSDHPDTFNQAIMEFGALQCTPKNPKCPECPVAIECFARKTRQQSQFPVKVKKTKVKKRLFTYLVFDYKGKLWMKTRQNGDIWQGLFDFHLLKEIRPNELSQTIEKELQHLNGSFQVSSLTNRHEFKHILTHQIIYASFIYIKVEGDKTSRNIITALGGGYYSLDEIKKLPKPVLVSKYLNEAIF